MSRFKNLFKKNFYFSLILILTISMGIYVISFLKNKSTDQVYIGGNFSLIDQNGNTYFSQHDKKKKLIYFGYTYCPDICPFDLLKLSNFLDKNPSVSEKVQSIFVSIDPERDNIGRINEYLSNFNPNILGLTGDAQKINDIKRKFRVYVKLNKKNSYDKDYLVDHTILFYLVNEDDKYITHFRPDELKVKLPKYL